MGDVIALRTGPTLGALLIEDVRKRIEALGLDERAAFTALLVLLAERGVALELPREGFVRCVGAAFDVEIDSQRE